MPKKRRKKRPTHALSDARLRFLVGDAVRIKFGTADPDAPELALGGFGGRVIDIDRHAQPPVYRVLWDRPTLEQLGPAYRERCARDHADVETRWLPESMLDADLESQAPVDLPPSLFAPTRRREDPADAVRAVFGLAGDAPLPTVTVDSLRIYHQYLSERLTFPFPGRFLELADGATEPTEYRVQVVALLGPDAADVEQGLLCEVEDGPQAADVPLAWIRVRGNRRARRLVEEYSWWFFLDRPEDANDGPTPRPVGLVRALVLTALVGAAYGAAVGALAGAAESALAGAAVGAALLAVLGVVLGLRLSADPEAIEWSFLGSPTRGLTGGIVGALAGGLLGAFAVVAVGTYVGVLAGGFVGGVLGALLAPVRHALFVAILGAVVGATLGALALAVWHDYAGVLLGMLAGAGVGAAAAVLLDLALLRPLAWLARRREAVRFAEDRVPKI